MLTYDLEARGKTPLYEYLYICIRNDILSGTLTAETKLPSKRELAANHGVSLITVENAYEQLLLEGYIYALPKRGYYVSSIHPAHNLFPANSRSENPTFENSASENSVLEKTVSEHSVSERSVFGNPLFNKGKQAPLIDFTSNHAAGRLFPYSVWAKLTRATLLEEERRFMESLPHTGVLPLREAIAGQLREFRGFSPDPEQIIIGAGTEYLYGLLVQLLGRNGMIAVEDPGHTKVRQVYESSGMKVLYIPVDGEGLCVDALEGNQVKAVHVSPSHQFPLGVSMPAVRRHKLLQWAAAQGSYIIEDDYDSEFRFSGNPLPSMAGIAPERVIYLNTFTKTLSPGIRIAYMVLPPKLMEVYQKKLSFYSCTVSATEQYTLAAFIREGYYGRHISRMRNFYRKQRAQIFEIVKDVPIRQKIMIEEASAGLHFILHIQTDTPDDVLTGALLERGIRIRAVSDYCHHSTEEVSHRLIVNYSDIDPGLLKKAFDILGDVLEIETRPKQTNRRVEQQKTL